MSSFAPSALQLACCLLFFVLSLPQSVSAWDAQGHELVATVAYGHLNPKAKQAVDQLAREVVNPEQAYNAISLACWMDDLRRNSDMPYHGQFLSWHFIDLPIDPRDPVPAFEPGDDNETRGNVVQALKRATVVLKGGTDPYIHTAAIACAIVMHLVGDIHQPLHCATKYFISGHQLHQDAGGNKELVVNGPPDDPRFNLHFFWDSAWRASFDEATGTIVIDPRYQERYEHNPENVRQLAKELEQQNQFTRVGPGPQFDEWARESNRIAHDFVYREITATGNRKFCRLSCSYVARANALARQRLVLAALRLATLLNETLGSDKPLSPPLSYPAGPPSQSY